MAFKYKGLRLKDPSLMKRLRRVTGITFTRTSVAYDYYGNPIPANTPRFGFGGIDGVLIEEAHTNLLPATESQSLNAPYTTGTLNGTYTFMIQGTGSITLSGGATGTVTLGNPVTATVSSKTVTLTPTGTATLVQILKLAYPLSWTLGGTTQAEETLIVPSNVLNIDTSGSQVNAGSGTIECEVFIEDKHKSSNYICEIISQMNPAPKNHIRIGIAANTLRTITGNSVGTVTGVSTPISGVNKGWNKVGNKWAWDNLSLYKNGIIQGTPNISPYLPSGYETFLVGGLNFTPKYQFNGIIKNVVISRPKRTDPIISNRALQPSPLIDKEITFIAPLLNDLKAYRVRT